MVGLMSRSGKVVKVRALRKGPSIRVPGERAERIVEPNSRAEVSSADNPRSFRLATRYTWPGGAKQAPVSISCHFERRSDW